MLGGAYYRLGDAPIFQGGIQHQNVMVNISYDLNTSSFVDASDAVGAIEGSLIYIITKVKPGKINNYSCPIF